VVQTLGRAVQVQPGLVLTVGVHFQAISVPMEVLTATGSGAHNGVTLLPLVTQLVIATIDSMMDKSFDVGFCIFFPSTLLQFSRFGTVIDLGSAMSVFL